MMKYDELKDYDIMDIEAMDYERSEKSKSGKIQVTRVYIKDEVDKVIADLEESYKMEVEQLLMEIAELKKQVQDYAQGLYVIQAKAEKETRHHKFRRCLSMAKICDNEFDKRTFLRDGEWEKWKWHVRNRKWLELAEKFKEGV